MPSRIRRCVDALAISVDERKLVESAVENGSFRPTPLLAYGLPGDRHRFEELHHAVPIGRAE